MTGFRIKNWDRFQHYKTGPYAERPEWIKLYRQILDDYEFHCLDGDDAKALIMLWMLAAERGGELPELEVISFRLRLTEQKVKACLERLSGHWLESVYTDYIPDEDEHADEDEDEERTSTPNGVAVREAFDLYNEVAGDLGLPRAEKLTDQRKRKLRSVLNAHGLPAWKRALLNLEQSKFCLGEGGRGWRANLDFMLQPTSFVKLLEGAYSDVEQGAEH